MTINSYSFVIPIYNEALVIPKLIDRLNLLMDKIEDSCEVVMVDDGSTDGSDKLIESVALSDKRYNGIFLSRNFGHQRALTAGLENTTAKIVMILDGDLQDPPELFFEFLERVNSGYDVVYGIRRKRKEGIIKRTLYSFFYMLLNRIADHKIPKDSGDFCMMRNNVVNSIIALKEEGRFIRGLRSWVGFKQIGLFYERNERAGGKPKYSFTMLFKLAYDGIFNFSVFPIKLLTFLGISCISVSIIYFFITLIRKFLLHDVPLGFTALLFLIILFGGVQLLSMGIIGEYVQRVFFQVKLRPNYIIRKRVINGIEQYE